MAEGRILARAFPLMLMALAMLLLMGPELFRVVDIFGNRMNTMFKLSYQAWTLLALACAYALYYLGSRYSGAGSLVRVAGYAWMGLLAIGLTVSAYYPAAAAYTKTSGLAGSGTLDGLAYVAVDSIGELRAIQWLKEHYEPGDVIVESVGGAFYIPQPDGRISASTGIPTVLGWADHERQWGRSGEALQKREEAVERLYQTRATQEAKEVLDRYGVTYVFVGPRERAQYGTEGLAKFVTLGDVVFQEGDVVIYRVRE